MNEEELNHLFPAITTREAFQVEMVDGKKVMVYRFEPNVAIESEKKETIIFVPGFTSYFSQWKNIINYLLANNYPVIVFESREKKTSTSKASDPRFNTEGLVSDLTEVVAYLKLPQPFLMIGNSLGSTMIMKHVIDNENNQELLPAKIVLLQAVYTSSPLQKFIDLAQRKVIFHIIMRFIRLFSPIIYRKKKKHSPNSYRNSLNNLRNADLEKMRVGLICSVELKIFDDLPKIKTPALAIGIANDEIHPVEQAKQIADNVQKGVYHEIADIETIDTEETARRIVDFFKK